MMPPVNTVAKRIAAVASTLPRTFPGGSKVWLCDVISATGLTKDELLAAHRASEIQMSRLDLASALSPEQREKDTASSIKYLGAEWNCVRVG